MPEPNVLQTLLTEAGLCHNVHRSVRARSVICEIGRLRLTDLLTWCAVIVVVELPQTPGDDLRSASAARGRRSG